MAEPAQDWLSEFAQEPPESGEGRTAERAGDQDWFSEFAAEESRSLLHLVEAPLHPSQKPDALSDLRSEPHVWFGRPKSFEPHIVVATTLFWFVAIGAIPFSGRTAATPASEPLAMDSAPRIEMANAAPFQAEAAPQLPADLDSGAAASTNPAASIRPVRPSSAQSGNRQPAADLTVPVGPAPSSLFDRSSVVTNDVPAPSRTAPAHDGEAAEQVAIQSVLGRYRRAFDTLNANGINDFWPTVNARTLGRAFDQLKEQSFTFDSCKIEIDGQRADASCSGTASFVPKVGGNSLREEPRLWTFRLQRVKEDWLIDRVESRTGQR